MVKALSEKQNKNIIKEAKAIDKDLLDSYCEHLAFNAILNDYDVEDMKFINKLYDQFIDKHHLNLPKTNDYSFDVNEELYLLMLKLWDKWCEHWRYKRDNYHRLSNRVSWDTDEHWLKQPIYK